jgi:hypothetical protein
VNGNGRKGGWYYEDKKGNGHFTHGKTPNRPLEKAFKATNVQFRIVQMKYLES